MRKTMSELAQRRPALMYCLLTFALTWTYEFAVCWPLVLRFGLQSLPGTASIAGAMFFPALGALLTRWLSGEGLHDAWIRPRQFGKTWRWYLAGWFLPLLLILCGMLLFYSLFPDRFDPSLRSYLATIRVSVPGGAVPEINAQTIGLFMLALCFAPVLNFLPCFGEEWGWRGYLLPKLCEKHRLPYTILVSGLVWGLWHAPITMLGHNYGTGYPGYPFTGILAMCVLTIVMGCIFSWLTLRAGSCVPAIFAHGMFNGGAALPLLFLKGTANPFVGPAATGIIGGAGFIVCALLCYRAMARRVQEGKSQFADGTGPKTQL